MRIRWAITVATCTVVSMAAGGASADAEKCTQGSSLKSATGTVADCLREIIKGEDKCLLVQLVEEKLSTMCDNDCIRLVDQDQAATMFEAEVDAHITALGLDKPNLTPEQKLAKAALEGSKANVPRGAFFAPLSGCIALPSGSGMWAYLLTLGVGEYGKKVVVTEEGMHAIQHVGRTNGDLPSGNDTENAKVDLWLEMGANAYVEVDAALKILLGLSITPTDTPKEEAQVQKAIDKTLSQLGGYVKGLCEWVDKSKAHPLLGPNNKWVKKFDNCKLNGQRILDFWSEG